MKINNIRALKDERVVMIAAGEYHAAAVTEKGKLFTWVNDI